jgi:hypothetical protein
MIPSNGRNYEEWEAMAKAIKKKHPLASKYLDKL